jgi:hypothetical protein
MELDGLHKYWAILYSAAIFDGTKIFVLLHGQKPMAIGLIIFGEQIEDA